MLILAANPVGTPSLSLCAGLRQWQSHRHMPPNEAAAPVLGQWWQRVKLRSVWTVAAESKMRIDFVQSRLAAHFPASVQAPLRISSGARRHSVFCFAFRVPVGSRLSQNKLENRGIGRRASFLRAPP